jgi:hypothetical protein
MENVVVCLKMSSCVCGEYRKVYFIFCNVCNMKVMPFLYAHTFGLNLVRKPSLFVVHSFKWNICKKILCSGILNCISTVKKVLFHIFCYHRIFLEWNARNLTRFGKLKKNRKIQDRDILQKSKNVLWRFNLHIEYLIRDVSFSYVTITFL